MKLLLAFGLGAAVGAAVTAHALLSAERSIYGSRHFGGRG